MAMTIEGAIKIAAKRLGLTVRQYKGNIQRGLLWCVGCQRWHSMRRFGSHKSRSSGHAQSCRSYRKKYRREGRA